MDSDTLFIGSIIMGLLGFIIGENYLLSSAATLMWIGMATNDSPAN